MSSGTSPGQPPVTNGGHAEYLAAGNLIQVPTRENARLFAAAIALMLLASGGLLVSVGTEYVDGPAVVRARLEGAGLELLMLLPGEVGPFLRPGSPTRVVFGNGTSSSVTGLQLSTVGAMVAPDAARRLVGLEQADAAMPRGSLVLAQADLSSVASRPGVVPGGLGPGLRGRATVAFRRPLLFLLAPSLRLLLGPS